MSCTYSLSIAASPMKRRLDVVVDHNYVDMIVLEDGDAEIIQFTWPSLSKVELELLTVEEYEQMIDRLEFVVTDVGIVRPGPYLDLSLIAYDPPDWRNIDVDPTPMEIEFPQLSFPQPIGEWK